MRYGSGCSDAGRHFGYNQHFLEGNRQVVMWDALGNGFCVDVELIFEDYGLFE